jgi:hypothetical protein
MVPAGSFVDVSKESDSVFGRYASLANSCGVALIEFSLDYREGLGASHDLSTVESVFW